MPPECQTREGPRGPYQLHGGHGGQEEERLLPTLARRSLNTVDCWSGGGPLNYFDPNLFSDDGRRSGGGHRPGPVGTAIAVSIAVIGVVAYVLLIVFG